MTKEANNKRHNISLADVGPDDVIVTWLLKRFKELPSESLKDIVLLMEMITNPQTPAQDRDEIYTTIREILFPQLIGNIVTENPASEHIPQKASKRIHWIGMKVRKYREEKNWTQQELAEKSGLQQAQISRLEAGVHSPSHKTLEKIAKALNITVGDIDPSN
jgi:predicted transcriptional regulator